MSTTSSTKEFLKGGEFLIKETSAHQMFTPEDFSEDQRMLIDMVKDFINTRIVPNREKIESLDIDLTKQLLKETGELGIIGIPFPEEYGGSEMDFITNLILSELMAEAGSFSLSFGANTGIGMLPLLYFGTAEQKQQYLPELVAGDKYAAYCLTEPGSGSDALNAKSTAVLSDDGEHYILNGQKMWITNAGFADLFTVFAKIDGEKFTGFLVERNWEGVSLGAEEKKLGIKGSSTRQVFFENVKVPVGNVLGAIGKGHKIAFNILNIGRIKLAAGAFGGSKEICSLAIQYANERKQFGQSISNFGAIQHKIAEQAIKIFVNETASYRLAQCIKLQEEKLMEEGQSMGAALLGAAEAYAIECALMKVHSSECLDFVVDEGLQIYGGMGYSEEGRMAAFYRDARINRIFEGTNEINRMLAVDRLIKSALKGEIDLMTPALNVQKELMEKKETTVTNDQQAFAREKQMIEGMKKAFLMVTGATVQKLMQQLSTEQEILMNLSDMMAEIYLSESALLRTEKVSQQNDELKTQIYTAMTQVFLDDAIERFAMNAKRAITGWADGEHKKLLLYGLHKLTRYEGINTKLARRKIAARLIEANSYCF